MPGLNSKLRIAVKPRRVLMLNNRVEGSRWHGSSSNINSQTNLSIELSEALSYISADLPRDEWVKVAAAWKSAGGDFDSWDEWSSKGQSYNSKDVLSVWNSLSVEGGIGPGTLFFLALQICTPRMRFS